MTMVPCGKSSAAGSRVLCLPGEKGGRGFGRLPDLILLDGGRGMGGCAAPFWRRWALRCPLFGMVKDDRHRTRAIAQGGRGNAIAPTGGPILWCPQSRMRSTGSPLATPAAAEKIRYFLYTHLHSRYRGGPRQSPSSQTFKRPLKWPPAAEPGGAGGCPQA